MSNTVDVSNVIVNEVLTVDGYTINPAYSTVGQFLAYDGHAYIPTTIQESNVSNLVSDLNSKAADSLVVHLAGSETITGTKTFSANPVFNSGAIPNAALANSSINFTSGDSSITVDASTSLGGTEHIALNLGHANTWSAKQTFTNHVAVDGYTIDLSGNATTNQALAYNGTSFIASNVANSISNSDGTLTISPTTGSVIASLNLSHANTWTADQTFQGIIFGSLLVFDAAKGGQVAATTAFSGDYTVGNELVPYENMTLKGISFYWGGGAGARTVRAKLWNSGGTELKSVDVSVNAAGIYTGTFSSTASLSVGTIYYITARATTGNYTLNPLGTTNFPAGKVMIGTSLYAITGKYSAGDAFPTSDDLSLYPISPIYTVP